MDLSLALGTSGSAPAVQTAGFLCTAYPLPAVGPGSVRCPLGPFSRLTCRVLTPAVYPDGRVCISILHAPGDDPMGYESSAERWSPVQSVEKILLSVVSMLAGNGLRPPWPGGGSQAARGCISVLIQSSLYKSFLFVVDLLCCFLLFH